MLSEKIETQIMSLNMMDELFVLTGLVHRRKDGYEFLEILVPTNRNRINESRTLRDWLVEGRRGSMTIKKENSHVILELDADIDGLFYYNPIKDRTEYFYF